MGPGTVMIIPPNIPREFRFMEDTIDIDIFAPQRHRAVSPAVRPDELSGRCRIRERRASSQS